MASMLIVLRRDPATGKQNIVVKLESDADALPVEHEQMHKALVEKLIGKGMKVEDLGEIIIEREGQTQPPAGEQEPAAPERAKEAQGR